MDAYNPDSGMIFDGFVAFGGGGMGSGMGAIPIDPALGISAPTLFLQGEGDQASMGAVYQVREMMDRGLNASSLARICMVRNVPHIDSDFVRGEPCGAVECTPPEQQPFFRAGGDRWKPMAAALLDALRRCVVQGNPPPPSILSGAPVDLNGDGVIDSLRFPQSTRPGPSFSFAFPYVDDPTLDQASGPPAANLQNNVALSNIWASVQQALRAETDSVFLPETACRRGRFSIVVLVRPASTSSRSISRRSRADGGRPPRTSRAECRRWTHSLPKGSTTPLSSRSTSCPTSFPIASTLETRVSYQ